MPARRAWRWLARHPWVTSLVMVAAFALAAGWRDLDRSADQDRYDRCVSGWAGELSARSVVIGEARREVDGTNDALWRGMAELLARPRPDAQQVFQGLLGGYVRASDRYRDALRDNPAPPPPELRCGR